MSDSDEVELAAYGRVLRRRAIIVILFAILGGAAGAAYASTQPPAYQASGEVLVRPIVVAPFQGGGTRPDQAVSMPTEEALAKSLGVAELAHTKLGTATSAESLRKKLTVTNTQDTQILKLTFQARTPVAAQRGAQAFVDAYRQNRQNTAQAQRQALLDGYAKRDDQLSADLAGVIQKLGTLEPNSPDRLSLQIEQAQLDDRLTQLRQQEDSLSLLDVTGSDVTAPVELPTSTSGFGTPVLAAAGAAAGLLVGIVLAFLIDALAPAKAATPAAEKARRKESRRTERPSEVAV